MLVLIVNAYDMDSGRGRHLYEYLLETVKSMILHETAFADTLFLERSFNEIGDLIVDWEHDHLHHETEEHCLKFDKVDLVVVGGDLSVLPWEPQASQVVSLIHMCKFTKKPLLAVGFGAYSAVYTMATRGTRFLMMNGPRGDSIEDISKFPRYSTPSGTFPSAWLDNETGDMYIYRKQTKTWNPVCNTGMHFQSATGKPNLQSVHPKMKLNLLKTVGGGNAGEGGMGIPGNNGGSLESDEDIVFITNHFLQHEYCKNLPLTKSFPVKTYRNWYINAPGGLPKEKGLQVMGHCQRGPVLMVKDNILMIGCRFEAYPNIQHLKTIIQNFFDKFFFALSRLTKDKLESPLYQFLFGEQGLGGDNYDTSNDRMNISPALSHVPIPSIVQPDGPVKVDPPLISMFVKNPKKDDIDYFALKKNRLNSSVGKKPRIVVQNPMLARQKRIQNAFKEVGMKDTNERIETAFKEQIAANPYGIGIEVSEQAQDLLAGLVMKDSSVTTRRHRVMRRLSYQAKHISLDDKAALAVTKATPRSVTIVESNEEEEDQEEPLDEDDEDLDVNKVQQPETTVMDGSNSHIDSSVILGALSSTDSHSFTRADNRRQPSTPPLNKKGVPTISDWIKVFEVAKPVSVSAMNQKTSTGTGGTISSSSDRIIRKGDALPSSAPQPSQPSSARSARSYKSTRTQNVLLTPRTAQDIMRARNDNFLPVSHPKTTLNNGKLPGYEPHRSQSSSLSTSEYFQDEIDEMSAWRDAYHSIDSSVGLTHMIPFKVDRSVSNYNKIVKKIEDQKADSAYKGLYKIEYRSQREAEIKEEYEQNKKNIAGPFKLACSAVHTELELRQEGLVRPHGPFPKFPGIGIPGDMCARDWNFVMTRKSEDWISGPWK